MLRLEGVLVSNADRIGRFELLLVAAVATAIFGGACQSQEAGEMRHESRTIKHRTPTLCMRNSRWAQES